MRSRQARVGPSERALELIIKLPSYNYIVCLIVTKIMKKNKNCDKKQNGSILYVMATTYLQTCNETHHYA